MYSVRYIRDNKGYTTYVDAVSSNHAQQIVMNRVVVDKFLGISNCEGGGIRFNPSKKEEL